MEVAVQVALVRLFFAGFTPPTALTVPSFKVRFETAFWLEPIATATGIATDSQRQFQIHQSLERPLLAHVSTFKIAQNGCLMKFHQTPILS
ncbi:hypothetical protein LFAB_05550 [Lactiplantibacillus fabifermentans T30PCM01]|uniref:Uncharacterized protein n=1 Tax=Lactiplantibacillus fabifermentans T30PCM01 TaxID=1400520 RepID=W6T8R4_9LACO|nr:hypothetical protein LFAB_05550 [Lactiplantibacillus fabifermentans T30PCM01]